jgi:hypothetical protein
VITHELILFSEKLKADALSMVVVQGTVAGHFPVISAAVWLSQLGRSIDRNVQRAVRLF